MLELGNYILVSNLPSAKAVWADCHPFRCIYCVAGSQNRQFIGPEFIHLRGGNKKASRRSKLVIKQTARATAFFVDGTNNSTSAGKFQTD